MKDLFYMGGPPFMSFVSVILIAMIAWTIYQALPIVLDKVTNIDQTRERVKHIKTIGLFGFITGILGQLVGLYEAFKAIETAGDVSPALLMGGLKVSMISTIYGFIVFLLSLLIWFIFDNMLTRKMS